MDICVGMIGEIGVLLIFIEVEYNSLWVGFVVVMKYLILC